MQVFPQRWTHIFYHFMTAERLHCIAKQLRKDVKILHHMREITTKQEVGFFSQRIKDYNIEPLVSI